MTDFVKLRETIEGGGAARYHEAAAARGKLFARERISLLTDAGRPSARAFAYRPSSVKLPASVSRLIRSRANSLPRAAAASW